MSDQSSQLGQQPTGQPVRFAPITPKKRRYLTRSGSMMQWDVVEPGSGSNGTRGVGEAEGRRVRVIAVDERLTSKRGLIGGRLSAR
jgi:hypothetical protein